MNDTYEQDMDEYRSERYQRMREHGDQEPVLPECVRDFVDLVQERSGEPMTPRVKYVLFTELFKVVTLAPSAKDAIKDILRWAEDSR